MASTEADWEKVSLSAQATSARLERDVAAVDAATPIYFVLVASVVATLFMVSCGLLVASDLSGSRGYLYALTFGISAILSFSGTLLSIREALRFNRRAVFCKRELLRHLKEAEVRAGFGFARVDKLTNAAEDPDTVEALRRLQDAIRESRIRLGMK